MKNDFKRGILSKIELKINNESPTSKHIKIP